MTHNVFISYSRHDFAEVSNFKKLLGDKIPNINCSFDTSDMESEEDFDEKIISAINDSSFLIVAVSDNSLKSEWVKKEVRYALNTGKTVLPLLLEGAELKEWLLFYIDGNDCTEINNNEQVDKLFARLSSNLENKSFSLSPSSNQHSQL